MGGDEGLAVMLAGVARARRRFEGMKFILVGDEERIRAGLQNHPKLTAHSEIVHAPDMIGSSERPSQAIRRAKTTSMGIANDMVKQGRAGREEGRRVGNERGRPGRYRWEQCILKKKNEQ